MVIMKKLVMALCMAFGIALAAGTDAVKKEDTKERVVELSKIDWADVQRGMAASNRYNFVEHNVTLVITNRVEDVFPMTLPPYRPIGRSAERIEPQDYLK